MIIDSACSTVQGEGKETQGGGDILGTGRNFKQDQIYWLANEDRVSISFGGKSQSPGEVCDLMNRISKAYNKREPLVIHSGIQTIAGIPS